MSVGRFLQQGAAGNAGEAVYVDDVFSTYVYEGNGSTQTITNGIDLAGEGGAIWCKGRSYLSNHKLFDTERPEISGALAKLVPNSTSGESGDADCIVSVNSDGFSIGGDSEINRSGEDQVAWTFRKQPGFFDVVTYTGDDTAGRTVSHNLGSVPGMIVVKRTDATSNWVVYHRGQNSGTNPEQYRLLLNTTSAEAASTIWSNTAPTSTEFTVTNSATVNANGGTYVAYLFAHDAQDFGTGSNESIIKCGSYTGTGSAQDIDLGFEPQWILIKRSNTTASWILLDSMRGIVADGIDPDLHPNDNNYDSQQGAVNFAQLNADGIKIDPGSNGYTGVNSNGSNYIYVAIRRPHKPAEEFAATDLFDIGGYTGTAGTLDPAIEFPFDTDMFMLKRTNATGDMNVFSRLVEYPTTGGNVALSALVTSSSSAESDTYTFRSSDAKDIAIAQDGADNLNVSGGTYIYYGFRRAPGFFDVVAYAGTGSSGLVVDHNLGATPELVIIKNRTYSPSDWPTLTTAVDSSWDYQLLNGTGAFLDATWFTASAGDFTLNVATSRNVNYSGNNYISYLFASVPGISKVGTVSHTTGSTTDVDCGFSSGARFVLVKRIDNGGGHWVVVDSLRGINAGNDPYLLLSSTAAQVTNQDVIDPLSSGFQMQGFFATGTWLFLAIA